jgi:uncharacterized lipoprotein YmbA
MKRIHIAIALALLSLIILVGCSGKMRYPNYYTLNLPAPPDPPAAENVKATVAIREFEGRSCSKRHQNQSVSMRITAGPLIPVSWLPTR